MDECSYARLRRWEKLNGQWVDHFNQDVSVEVILTGGRVMLLCRVYNSSHSVWPVANCISNTYVLG